MAKFFKKVIPEHTANPNSVYPDLYDNGNTTFDLQVGTVSDITANKLILADMQLPTKPVYGDAKLVGAKANLFINSIDTGDLSATPAIKVWKLANKIENREGGATDATMIADTDVAVFSSYVAPDNSVMFEDFEGKPEENDDTTTRVVGANVVAYTAPYLLADDAYDFGRHYGAKGHWPSKGNRKRHFKLFGSTDEIGNKVVKIKSDRRRHQPYAYKSAVNTGNKFFGGPHERYKKDVKKYIKYTRALTTGEKQSMREADNGVVANRVNETNSFFDMVRREVPQGGIVDGKYK